MTFLATSHKLACIDWTKPSIYFLPLLTVRCLSYNFTLFFLFPITKSKNRIVKILSKGINVVDHLMPNFAILIQKFKVLNSLKYNVKGITQYM